MGADKRKRKLARSKRRTKRCKRRKALEQAVAKDRPRHAYNAAHERTGLKVGCLERSGPAYAGNLGRREPVPVPRELGCGYRLLKYTPG